MFDVNDYEKEIEMFNNPENKMTLAEIAADALKPENQRVYPVGTKRNWQAELDAQRLRADTAEAELIRSQNSLLAARNDLESHRDRADDAEQLNANLTGLLERMLKDDDMPVRWFAESIDAALNPNPEAESHEPS